MTAVRVLILRESALLSGLDVVVTWWRRGAGHWEGVEVDEEAIQEADQVATMSERLGSEGGRRQA